METTVANEEIAIGIIIIASGFFAPIYIYLKKRELLKNKMTIYYLVAEVIFCIVLGTQFIFDINS